MIAGTRASEALHSRGQIRDPKSRSRFKLVYANPTLTPPLASRRPPSHLSPFCQRLGPCDRGARERAEGEEKQPVRKQRDSRNGETGKVARRALGAGRSRPGCCCCCGGGGPTRFFAPPRFEAATLASCAACTRFSIRFLKAACSFHHQHTCSLSITSYQDSYQSIEFVPNISTYLKEFAALVSTDFPKSRLKLLVSPIVDLGEDNQLVWSSPTLTLHI